MKRKLFLFGMGYTGAYIAQMATQAGFSVCATVRDKDRAQAITNYGIPCFAYDGHIISDEMATEIRHSTHIISTVAPSTNDPVINSLSRTLDGVDNKWLGYLSSTGVYGDHNGNIVTEDTPIDTNTLNITNVWRVDAENAWLEFAQNNNHNCAIFRISGIYGKGRNLIEKALNGDIQRIHKPGHVFNRIHVEDIAGIITKAMIKRKNNTGIFNLADDMPTPASILCEFACGLIGIKPPPRIDYEYAHLSPMARQFWESSRIVDNTKIKQQLDYQLKYPTYRHGLQAIYNQIKNQ